jgi:putative ABC transport system ATP-binding protein
MELIHEEVKGRGTASIIVTHDIRMTHFADRTVEIVDGRLDGSGHRTGSESDADERR